MNLKAQKLVIQLARKAKFRGSGRLLESAFPCKPDASRFIHGVFPRTDRQLMLLDSRNWIDRNILFHGDLEVHLTKLWERMVKPGHVVVDVGGNIGVHTLTFARLVGTTGRVLSVEPNPIVRTVLEKNLSLNGTSNVLVCPFALGSEEGVLPLKVPKKGTPEYSNMGLASLTALDSPHDLVDVPVRTMDHLLEDHSIEQVALVKIDVQGFEWFVLQGMTATMKKCRPVIVFEYEDWAWTRSNVDLAEVIDWLSKQHYKVQGIEANGEIRNMTVAEIVRHTHIDLIATFDGKA